MRTRYEYIIKSVKFYRGGESLYAAYKDKLSKYGEVVFNETDKEVHFYTRNLSFFLYKIGCEVVIHPATQWQRIPYIMLWDRPVTYANELIPV
jgi:hypothetical protein